MWGRGILNPPESLSTTTTTTRITDTLTTTAPTGRLLNDGDVRIEKPWRKFPIHFSDKYRALFHFLQPKCLFEESDCDFLDQGVSFLELSL